MCMVRIPEREPQVGRQVMSLAPHRVQDFLDCLANAFVPMERAEWRSDLPDGVRVQIPMNRFQSCVSKPRQ